MKQFVIVPLEDIIEEMFDNARQADLSECRKNIAEDEVLFSFDGVKPEIFDEYTEMDTDTARAFLDDSANGWIIE